MPEKLRWVLRLYGIKYLPHLERCIQQEDYTSRGVMQQITVDSWDEYWASAPSNKAKDIQGTDGNLFKAMRTAVTIEKGEEHERTVLTRGVTDDFRRLLNVVIDTGMVYSDWSDELLLTLAKVRGSSKLTDVRPIGLVILLRNTLMALQYEGVQQTWHELQVMSKVQYGSTRRLGTSQCRLLQNCAYEQSWIYKSSIGGGNEDKRRAFDMPSQTMSYYASMEGAEKQDTLTVSWCI